MFKAFKNDQSKRIYHFLKFPGMKLTTVLDPSKAEQSINVLVNLDSFSSDVTLEVIIFLKFLQF